MIENLNKERIQNLCSTEYLNHLIVNVYTLTCKCVCWVSNTRAQIYFTEIECVT